MQVYGSLVALALDDGDNAKVGAHDFGLASGCDSDALLMPVRAHEDINMLSSAGITMLSSAGIPSRALLLRIMSRDPVEHARAFPPIIRSLPPRL